MLKSSRYGSIAAGILAVLAALPPIGRRVVEVLGYGDTTPFPPGLIYAATAFASVCVIAGAVLVSTDFVCAATPRTPPSTRSTVQTGAFDATKRVPRSPTISSTRNQSTSPLPELATAERFAVKLMAVKHRLLVLAIGSDPGTGVLTTFLVGRTWRRSLTG